MLKFLTFEEMLAEFVEAMKKWSLDDLLHEHSQQQATYRHSKDEDDRQARDAVKAEIQRRIDEK